ncbi:hypothetical protein [Chitinophaga sancti]|uniref:Uncharacterized protein n=1 Tax=Chitinophaga sancti TaxID=1004 RepID=A0A1K1SLE3_9BACT|nr:hypothetical protein [Chitinophaga sancti]WQD65433.1 hypothetical protein U0033_13615 [Chitinophaga sancti]WQG88944.1 hypothetical protein SR876_28855 [Chitinophaga sancti]SFW85012.1 hypothetical protein SAMN05661012_05656 [Chitinophaga sancti]
MAESKKQVVTPNATAAAYAKKAAENVIARTGQSTEAIVRSSFFTKSDIKSGAWKEQSSSSRPR